MKHQLSLFITSFIITTSLFAQHDFRDGMIIMNDHTTIPGLIDLLPNQENAFECNFKNDSLSPIIKYFPGQINEYSFKAGKRYVSKHIKTDNSSASYFLECLVDGDIDLYYLRYLGIDHYFIEYMNEVTELRNDIVTYTENGKTFSRESNSYKRILSHAMKDTDGISANIERTPLNRSSLIKLFADYHRLSNKPDYYLYNDAIKKHARSKWFIHLGLGVGFNYTFVKTSSKIKIFPAPNTAQQPSYVIGSNIPGMTNSSQKITVQSVLPYFFLNITNNSRHSFQIEFSYLKNKIADNGFTVLTQTFMTPVIYKHEFRYYKKIKPFVDAGVAFRYDVVTKIDNMYIRFKEPVSFNSNQLTYQEREYVINEQSAGFGNGIKRLGIIAGAGLSYQLTSKKRLEFELRAEKAKTRFDTYFASHIFGYCVFKYINTFLIARISF